MTSASSSCPCAALEPWGWDQRFATAFDERAAPGVWPARVIAERGAGFRLVHAAGEADAVVAGRLRQPGAMLPAVGDWVAVRLDPGRGAGRVEAVLPRRSQFSRQAAGGRTREQVVAANVDVIVIVMGLDGDFNPRRLERALLLAWEGGAQPVVLLNKSDACDETASRVAEIQAVSPGVEVFAASARTGAGLDSLGDWLGAGRTLALVGSSGVGKSTLLNRLLGEGRQRVREVRASDSRGRHTTSHRELFRLPGGALVIDTPGLRELQLWADPEALPAAFGDVEALAPECGFRDCTHRGEPRCAVAAAVAEGRLDAARLDAFHKLEAELRHASARRDGAARAEERRRWKSIHRSMRHHPKR